MDDRAVHRVRQHYDRHANAGSSQEALRRRRQGPALPLKRFHNLIKERLIHRFCFGVGSVLDLCCGRGGDIRKWAVSKVRYVKGIDLSAEEIREAKRRWSEYSESNTNTTLHIEFESSDILGRGLYTDDRESYDAVTCFFALHYFTVTESAIDNLLLNVSRNLKMGGYFVCTCPDGKRVISALTQSTDRKKLQTPMLTIVPKWSGSYQCFGTAFTCSITDTVTEGAADVDGSYEYLVFTTPLKHIGAKFGLKLISDYKDEGLNRLFDKGDEQSGFKHFRPQFRQSDPSLELVVPPLYKIAASALNMAFVFQKVADVTSGERDYSLAEIEKLPTTLPSYQEAVPSEVVTTKKRKGIVQDSPETKAVSGAPKKSRTHEMPDDKQKANGVLYYAE